MPIVRCLFLSGGQAAAQTCWFNMKQLVYRNDVGYGGFADVLFWDFQVRLVWREIAFS